MRVTSATKQIPHKYDLTLLLNGYDNVNFEDLPTGWVEFEEVGVNRRKKSHRFALEKSYIYTYEIYFGCHQTSGRSHRGIWSRWKPTLSHVMHKDQVDRFWEIVFGFEKRSKKRRAKR